MKNSNDQTDQQLSDIKSFYEEVYYANCDDNLDLPGHYFRLRSKLGLSAGQSLLDVACGRGEWLKVNQQAGLHVSGIDLSEKAISTCISNMPAGDFHACSANVLPFADNSFDAVTCLGSLEHFVDPVGCLREMVRVSKPDAQIVILVPNLDFLTRKLGLFGGTYQTDAKEEVRTLDEWGSVFVQAGLRVESRWKDLHVLSWSWIAKGRKLMWPLRALQALLLTVWPLRWQYQVFHKCSIET